MNEIEFIEKFNNSYLGKELRAKKLIISQKSLDEINAEYNTEFQLEDINNMVQFDILSKYHCYKSYKAMTEKNEFRFSSISEIEACIKNFGIDSYMLLQDEKELLIETFKLTGLKELNLFITDGELLDISELPIESLMVRCGNLSKGDFCKLPNVKILKLLNVDFSSIEDLLVISNLVDLEIMIHPASPQIDLTQIDKFTNLQGLEILGQSLSQEDFEKICTLINLKKLAIGIGRMIDADEDKYEGHQIDDFSSVFNLKKLEDITDLSSLNAFCGNFIISDIEELSELEHFKLFSMRQYKQVTYIGKEPIPVDFFDNMENIELTILSPSVIEKEFAEKYENKTLNGKILIDNDLYKEYTPSEIYLINTKMKEIINGIPPEASEVEKVAYICKRIAEICFYDRSGCKSLPEEYNPERTSITRSLKGGLLEGKVVCRGFVIVLKKFLDEIGIDCRIVSGEGDGEPHAWNQVKIDGVWYNLDLTWDAPRIRAGKVPEYFLVNDKIFYIDHIAQNVDDDINQFICDGKFDFGSYNKSLSIEEKPHRCKEIYDREKVKSLFSNSQVQDVNELFSDDAMVNGNSDIKLFPEERDD